jgi:hypothetical protein
MPLSIKTKAWSPIGVWLFNKGQKNSVPIFSVDVDALRRGADVAVLLTDVRSDVCGVGKVDSIASGNTLAVVKKKCGVGYYSFGHEVGMISPNKTRRKSFCKHTHQ